MNTRQIHIFFKISKAINTTVCFVIHALCKSCQPEIVLAVLQIKTKTISCSQTFQNVWITIILLWNFWRKYGYVSYLFRCTHNHHRWSLNNVKKRPNLLGLDFSDYIFFKIEIFVFCTKNFNVVEIKWSSRWISHNYVTLCHEVFTWTSSI